MRSFKIVLLSACLFVFALATPSPAVEDGSPAPMAITNSVTVTMIGEGGKEESYSVKNINDYSFQFPIYDAGITYVLSADWGSMGQNGIPQLFINLLNPNFVPENTSVLQVRMTLEKGKRQFIYSNPNYSLWIQIDEVKKEPLK